MNTILCLLILVVSVTSLQSTNLKYYQEHASTDRRRALLSVVAASSALLLPQQPSLAAIQDDTVVLSGTVTLAADVELPSSTASSALYLTCRPDKPDNVPAAILNGSRGKSPPVLAARIENPTFPFDFSLISPRDLTVEGAANPDGSTNDNNLQDFSSFWWSKEDLIVSARWDSDGVAATRSPDDLVGRNVWKYGQELVDLQLEGRGAFGKFATGKTNKK